MGKQINVFCSNWIRTLVSMATKSFYSLRMGKMSYWGHKLINICSQKWFLGKVLYVSYELSKSINMHWIGCYGNIMGQSN